MSVSRTRGAGPQDPDDDDDNSGTKAWKIPPFWHKLNSFFLFPFQMEPLIYSIILALCSYLLMLGGFFSLFVAAALVLAISRYAFKVAALASRGITDSNDYRPHMMDSDWNVLPWKFFGVLIVHLFWIGWLHKISPGFGALGSLLSSLAIPATLMVLINTCSLRSSINPFNLLSTMAGIGLSYLLLCLFLFLLMQGAPMAISLLGPKVPKAMLIPSIAFVVIYFVWVMASMIGYVMYQNHAALDIQPVKPPEMSAEDKPEDPVAAEAKRRDAAIAKYVQSGDMQSAIEHAREWQRTGYDNLADQRRYHRLIKLTDQTETLAMHAQSFVPLLLKLQREGEALEVWSSCVKRAPLFKFYTADTTLVLARSAWKNMQGPQVLGLLQGFERNFPDHPQTPEAQELIVRALKQGVNKPEQALRVFMRMKSRYPDHPSTKEAEWILRDDLQRVTNATV